MKERTELAEKLEIVGEMFETEGMAKLMEKLQPGMNTINFNAIIIQIEGKLLKTNPKLAAKIILMNGEKTEEEVAEMEDAEFAVALRNAIIVDVLGFFESSPRTGGKK